MRMKLCALSAMLFLIGACLPGFVSAHAYIYQSEPLANAELERPPARIKLVFTEKINVKVSQITVENTADGSEVKGKLSHDGDLTLLYDLPALDDGVYKVVWQVLSLDTHVTDGSFKFAVGVKLEQEKPDETASLDGGASAGGRPGGGADGKEGGEAGAGREGGAGGKGDGSGNAAGESGGSGGGAAASKTPAPYPSPSAAASPSPSAVESPSPVAVQPAEPKPSPPSGQDGEEESPGRNGTAAADDDETASDGGLRSDEDAAGEDEAKGSGGNTDGSANDDGLTAAEPGNPDADPAPDPGTVIGDGSNGSAGAAPSGHEHHSPGGHGGSGQAGRELSAVLLRIADAMAGAAVGALLFVRYGLWRNESSPLPPGFSLQAERYVMLGAALTWTVTGWSKVGMLMGQFETVSFGTVLTDTMLGQMSVIRPAAALLLTVLSFAPEREARWANPLKYAVSAAVIATFPLTGHAYSAIDNAAAAIAAHTVHMGVAAIWIGGLTALWLLAGMKESLPALNRVAARFSFWALPGIFLVALSGIWLAAGRLNGWSELLGTRYGLLLTAKGLLLALIVALGSVHRFAFMPRIDAAVRRGLGQTGAKAEDDAAARGFRTGLRMEVAAAAALIVLAGWLASTSPPHRAAEAAREPFYWHVMGEDAHMTLRIQDADKGSGQLVRLYVWMPEGSGGPEDVAVIIRMPDGSASEVPLVPHELGEELYEFPGFTKYAFYAEGDWVDEEAYRGGVATVHFADAEGRPFEYERELAAES